MQDISSTLSLEFNYASINLKPYVGDSGDSGQLLKSALLQVREKDYPKDKLVVDRFKSRKGNTKRELVLTSLRILGKGVRIFGRIALIKNKSPLLLSSTNIIEAIEREENKKFVEVSSFMIHFSDAIDPVIMFEYNNEGPRLSDFIFYMRQVIKDLRIAKSIEESLHLKEDFSKLDKQISNVFGIVVKVEASSISKLNWLKSLTNVKADAGFQDVRLEMFYKRVRNPQGRYEKNILALDFARNIIDWLRNDKGNIENVEDLKMTYQIEGSEEIIDLDFIKNKVVSFLEIPKVDGKSVKMTDFTSIVGQEFNLYLTSGETTRSKGHLK